MVGWQKAFIVMLGINIPFLENENENFRREKKVRKSKESKGIKGKSKLSSSCELNEDAFMHTEKYVTAAALRFMIIDENDGEDINIQD